MTNCDDKKTIQKEKRHALNREIGSRVRDLRITAGITQEKFAEFLDVSVQFVSDMERGLVGASLVTIIEISKIFNSSTDYILRGKISDNLRTFQFNDMVLELDPPAREIIEHSMQVTLQALNYLPKNK